MKKNFETLLKLKYICCFALGMALISLSLSTASYAAPDQKTDNNKTPTIYEVLKPTDEIMKSVAKAMDSLFKTDKGPFPIPGIEAYAKLVLRTSSVEWTSGRRYAILYSTFSDLFTIIQFDSSGKPTNVFLVAGKLLGQNISQGKIADEEDLKLRYFRQRPKLQRDLTNLLTIDESGILTALNELNRDQNARNKAIEGLLRQVQGMDYYNYSPCRDVVENYRNSETFFIRFPDGKAGGVRMKPQVAMKISLSSDYFVLQDDRVARETAFLEVTPSPSCQVKHVTLFFAY